MLEAVVGVALRAILFSVLLGGVLSGLVYLATRQLALSATTRHALWTTAMIAMAVMPLAGVGMSVARAALQAPMAGVPARHHVVVANTAAVATHASEVTTAPVTSNAGDTPPTAARVVAFVGQIGALAYAPRVARPLAMVLVGAWIAGALIGMFGLALSVLRVRGLRRRSSPLDGELANELPWLTETSGGREIYLRLSYETETPVAIGFRRPVILIPTELATADGLAAIESLILHEHAHLRRYDDWTNLVQRTIERIFWFNPLVWIVGRRIALEREIASDDAVVEKTGEAKAYATSLWRLAREMRMPEHAVVAPGALLTRKQISVRIEKLLDVNRTRLHRSPAAALGIATAAIFAVIFVATSSPAIELPASAAPLAVIHTHSAPPPHRHLRLNKVVVVADESTAPSMVPVPGPIVAPRAAAPQPAPHIVTSPIVIREAGGISTAERAKLAADVARLRAEAAKMRTQQAIDKAQLREHVRGSVSAQLSGIGETLRQAFGETAAAASAARTQSHGATFDGVTVSRSMVASCVGCSFHNADLHGVDLSGLSISGDTFRGANLRGANLSGTKLTGDSFTGADLTGANLSNALLSGVELGGATLDHANLSGVKLVGVELRNVALHNVALRDVIASCTGCDLSGMDLRGQDLHGITLVGADFSGADLRNANLRGAHLSGIDFSRVNLRGADLTDARLDGCDLSGVDLHGARTTGLVLTGSGTDG